MPVAFDPEILRGSDMFAGLPRGKELRDKTRGAGEPKRWGDHCKTVFDNMTALGKRTEEDLTRLITEAVNDPARGPRYALWLIDELTSTFDGYRRNWL